MQETVGGTCVKMPECRETPSPRLVSEGLKHREGEGPPGRLLGVGRRSVMKASGLYPGSLLE